MDVVWFLAGLTIGLFFGFLALSYALRLKAENSRLREMIGPYTT